ncbi:MAG: ComEA family DNA-binding protein [Gemmatimonadaceae bacterium]
MNNGEMSPPRETAPNHTESFMNRFASLSLLVSMPALAFIGSCSSGSSSADDTATAIADTAALQTASTTTSSPTAATTGTTASGTASGTIVPININTATDAEILRIPGVGPRMLREFKEYRPYTSIEQFRREIGKYVDKAEVARLEQYIVIK